MRQLDDFLHKATDAHGYLGAVALIAQHGEVVALRAAGHSDLARRAPMRTDAIFRIYSMTKTIVTVMALQLVEEGRLVLDAPIEKILPAFAAPRVLIGGSAEAPQTRAAARTITLRDLLTHTAGFANGPDTPPAAAELLRRADLDHAASLDDYVARLARVPLACDPGVRFAYDGAGLEVAARMIEIACGEPLESCLRRRIFAPLDMRDTGFSVTREQRARVVDLVSSDVTGALVLADTRSAREPGTMLKDYPSGAGGLYSTARDYARFAQMLLNGGALDGVRIIERNSVESMMHDQLRSAELPRSALQPGETFGLGGSIVIDPVARGRPQARGAFGWPGAASTYYTLDRDKSLVAILLLQYLPRNEGHDLPKISTPFYNLVYQALTPAARP